MKKNILRQSTRIACLTAALLLVSIGMTGTAQKAVASTGGQPVYEQGDGYGYRIPAVTVTHNGTVLAFAERRVGLHDHAKNDIVLRRSTDNGATWGPMQVLADEGGDSLNDPCVVVLASGRILLRYTRFPEGVHARNSGHTVIAEPGYGGPKNVRVYLMHSDDDGVTWSAPREVTQPFRRESAVSVGSPGCGIQLTRGEHAGRILFPLYEVDDLGDGQRKSSNSVVYSDDDGATWTLTSRISEGDTAGGGNEAQLIEVNDGDVLITSRNQWGDANARKIAESSDGGATWTPLRLVEQLETPACMSSVTRVYPPEAGSNGWLVHSLPNTRNQRANGTLFVSKDEGSNWTRGPVVDPGPFAYSCLTRLANGNVGCLYEANGYRSIDFISVSLDTLLDAVEQEETLSKTSTSFEECSPGRFTEVETTVGLWTVKSGDAEIDPKHRRTGKQCLHLFGGPDSSSVELKMESAKPNQTLAFHAERWTSRSPFGFVIEQSDDGVQWKQIYDGQRVIRVGGFLTRVAVPLEGGPAYLRLTCTSPPTTGILIDDFALIPPMKQRITNVTVTDVQTPVLVGVERNPLLKVQVDVEGTLEPLALTSASFGPGGTVTNGDIASVAFYSSGDSSQLTDTAQPFGEAWGSAAEVGQPFVGRQELQHGANYFWLSCTLTDVRNIDNVMTAVCRGLTFSDDTTHQLQSEGAVHRLGVAVRKHGDDGINTYRIPGLVTTNMGTLIGVYDIRHRGSGDLPGHIDVGMSRSTDGGRTWEPMRTIIDMGADPNWNYDGIGDPAVLVDRTTGTIWVVATWSHGNRSWRASGPGMTPEETGQLMMVRSDDDGISWSKPLNVTEQVKRPEWCFLLQGPGKGITMQDGTIVFAAQYQDPPELNRLPHSTIIYSKDHGRTWHVGTGACDDTTEAQVVEVEPGVLMLNCRYNRKAARIVMTTRDMGATWQKHPTSERALIEPGSCMASLIDVDAERGKNLGGWLLFSNPDSIAGRHHMTIKASADRGMSWPKQHRLLLDEGPGRGYSCMTMIDDDTVGILYEGSQADMTFQRIPLDVLISDEVTTAQPTNAVTPSALKMPLVFSDHMVLQAGAPIPVWGKAKPGETVTVTLGNTQLATTADSQGGWQVRFPMIAHSNEPIALIASTHGEEIRLEDILVGEVWVAAGQSNMEWTLDQTTNGADELANADHPGIRLLHLKPGARGADGKYGPEELARLTPEAFCQGQWEVASAESARNFSAVAWYFARHLHQELGVPIGVICPSVGGTPTEAWISSEALQQDPELRGLVAGNWLDNPLNGEFCRMRGEQNLLQAIQAGEAIPGDEFGPNHSFKPGFMWEAGIKPLIPFAIRGAIWYQGESNAESMERTQQHEYLFPFMIQQWRKEWGQGEFPFLFVQLPAITRKCWPWFRDGQRRTYERLDNVGMAVTIDTGHPTNVHPSLKKPVGKRLAAYALGTTYGVRSTYCGPLLAGHQRSGEAIILQFKHVGDGLTSSDGQPLRHFEIAGDDGIFYRANATIIGANQVSVSSASVPYPTDVRYVWTPFPEPPVNLFNSAGIPASPFTTQEEQRYASPKRANDGRPNILLIVGEDHGCELSCYGDPVVKTPHIDRLAAGGVLFEHGYVTQSVCSPSRSTIFTGLYPHQNGQLGLATHNYGWFERWPTSYSMLKQAGYRTGLIGKTHIIPLDAVESFVDFRYQPSSNFSKKNVAEYAVKAGEFFRSDDQPFFMTVNYPDAHWPLQGQVDGLPETQIDPERVDVLPFMGDPNPRLLGVVQNYYDCMLRLDACVGQLLQQLEDSGKADTTLVIFIGDHGAQMARGKVTVYEGGMRVPYIVRWPGVAQAGRRSEALVSTIDLLPTFLDAAGVRAPDNLPGKSLRPVLDGAVDGDFREFLACERNCDAAHLTFPQRTIRDTRYKLIYSPVRDREDPAARYYRIHGASHWAGSLTDEELAADASDRTRAGYARWMNPPLVQLYDLNADPHEWDDLAADPAHAATKQRMLDALKRWQQETRDPLADPQSLRMLMEENDAVHDAGRRWPSEGWQYLDYIHPDRMKD